MKLKISSIQEKGNASKEYVWLEVTEDCDLSYYGLADTTFTSDGKIANKLRHFFWFPSKSVKKGEQVVLRTGAGNHGQYVTSDGKVVHRYFWGLGSSVWNDDGDAAVLFEIETWNTTRA